MWQGVLMTILGSRSNFEMQPRSSCDPALSAGPVDFPVERIVEHCNIYKGADAKRSIFQLVTTLALFAAACGLMFYGVLSSSVWITGLLLLPAGGLLTRIFIFQHDCGHGSFLNSARANDWVGRFLGILTVTPYDFWRRAHNMHHATSGDLSRRSIGGIDTLTLREYRDLPKLKQLAYRLYRNPFVLIVLGAPLYTIIGQRIPFSGSFGFYKEYKTLPTSSIWKSILLTDLMIVSFYGALALAIGWQPVVYAYLPVVIVTSCIGGWLFYIQHQFEHTYWQNSGNWNMNEAALKGSSYLALPKILQWFTGNIGFHHIHHLCLKIPNYKLQECMDSWPGPELKTMNRLSLRDSLDCFDCRLWDEETKRLVPFPGSV